MKNYFSIFLIGLVIAIPVFSCKTTAQAKVSATENYRLVVSFISKGTGIDNKIHEQFEKFLQENSKKTVSESFRWGREGEIDYCFQLKELSKKEQTAFVDAIRKIVGTSDVVLITENAPCVHKK